MDKENIVLYLPFDESNGSSVAYDYSQTRADGVVDNATFVHGLNGNAIEFDGEGKSTVTEAVLGDLSGDWTICAWVKSLTIEVGSPTKMTWALNFADSPEAEEVQIDVAPKTWVNLAIVKESSTFRFYVNANLVKTIYHNGTLSGVSLNQDYYASELGLGCVDDCKVYNVALTQEEIASELSETTTIEYYIDGQNIKDVYGVCVSSSKGVVNRPKLKTPTSVSWDNYHGEVVDLNHKYYEQREITLSCFIRAENKTDFVKKVSEFEQIFDKKGYQRLMISVHPVKPLVYEVYCKDEISVTKTWNDSLMVGTFDLKLVEAEPVKRVLKHTRVSNETKECAITLTSDKYVNVYWGDDTSTVDVCGTGTTKTHTYNDNGEYFVIITGCIDEITDFSTNAIVVWNRL